MYRIRVKDAKRVISAINLCSVGDDDRVLSYLNRACERLLYMMKSVGTVFRYEVCVNDNCITWPRPIETIESVAINKMPGSLRNMWYETLGAGPGISAANSAGVCARGGDLIYQGEFCSFDNVAGTGRKLAVYVDNNENVAGDQHYINLQFFNSVAQWTRGTFNGEFIDGEKLALPGKGQYVYTTNFCMANGLVRVSKDITNGPVRLFEYNPVGGALKPLAYYDPDETVPVYRRDFIPGLSPNSSSTNGCTTCSVIVNAKARFIPASGDDDFLQISNIEAIRLACQAILFEENKDLKTAVGYWAMAKQLMNEQRQHHDGDGVEAPIQVVGSGMFSGAVESFI
jgi:hypothetical protein